MLEADETRHKGRYHDALRSAFVRQGILSLTSAVAAMPAVGVRRGITGTSAASGQVALPRVALAAADYGLGEVLMVSAAAEPKRFGVASAAPDVGAAESSGHDRAAATFVEDLFRRGRIDLSGHSSDGAAVVNPLARKTHVVKKRRTALILERQLFDCGLDCG
jgi:hypothetical protein